MQQWACNLGGYVVFLGLDSEQRKKQTLWIFALFQEQLSNPTKAIKPFCVSFSAAGNSYWNVTL